MDSMSNPEGILILRWWSLACYDRLTFAKDFTCSDFTYCSTVRFVELGFVGGRLSRDKDRDGDKRYEPCHHCSDHDRRRGGSLAQF